MQKVSGRPATGDEICASQRRICDANLHRYRLYAINEALSWFNTDDIDVGHIVESLYMMRRANNLEQAYTFVSMLELYDKEFAQTLQSPQMCAQFRPFAQKVVDLGNQAAAQFKGMSMLHLEKITQAGKTIEKTTIFKFGDSITADFDIAKNFMASHNSVIIEMRQSSLKNHRLPVIYDHLSCLVPKSAADIMEDSTLGVHWAHMIESRLPICTPVWTRTKPDLTAVKVDRVYIPTLCNNIVEKAQCLATELGAEVMLFA